MTDPEQRIVVPFLDYIIEVHERTMSAYSEDGEWLDGDTRIIREQSLLIYGYAIDADPDEDGDPETWATHILRPMASFEPSQYPIGLALSEHAWLTGVYNSPFDDTFDETTARLTGAWSDEQRAAVFRAVTA